MRIPLKMLNKACQNFDLKTRSILPCLSYLLDFSELVASGEDGSDVDDTAKCGDGVEDVI